MIKLSLFPAHLCVICIVSSLLQLSNIDIAQQFCLNDCFVCLACLSHTKQFDENEKMIVRHTRLVQRCTMCFAFATKFCQIDFCISQQLLNGMNLKSATVTKVLTFFDRAVAQKLKLSNF